MRKCYLFFGIAGIFAAGYAFAKGEFFVVKEGCVVPLYNTEDLKSLPYYVGHYGTSCRKLMSVFVGMPYWLRGFDCCGVVYYVAGGLLKRTTWGIREQGKLLRCFDKKSKEISREELAKFLDTLCDTDCIILRGRSEEDIKRIPEYSAKNIGTDPGHLAVWYNGGILEFRGVDYGCEYRQKREEVFDRVMRWIKLVKDSKNDQCDLRFIRWHPELLKEEFKTYFPQEK